jgi:hypothetical protein
LQREFIWFWRGNSEEGLDFNRFRDWEKENAFDIIYFLLFRDFGLGGLLDEY